jgi:phenylacetate-CoA ligase
MSVYAVLARNVMAPTLDFVRGTSTMRCLRDLEQSQWWPLERIQELQTARLKLLIDHAYTHVPHYRTLMDARGLTPADIRNAYDLALLPVLTRQDVQQLGRRMIADNWPQELLRVAQTSGSTGTPLQFYSTREDQADHGAARSIRAMSWAGLNLGDRVAFIGQSHPSGPGHRQRLQALSYLLRRTVSIYDESLSDEGLPHLVRRLSKAHVTGTRSYPNVMALIAAFIRDNDLPVPEVSSIITGGAELLTHERALIRGVFGTEPHSDYSSFEAFEMACECRAHEGLHISAEDIVLEIVDDSGAPLPPGEEGRIVMTNLHNYGMPFIRYDMGDSGSMLAGTCPCKRTLPRLGALVGRKNRIITTRSGSRIFFGPLFLNHLAGLGMRQYQIVQESVNDVVMRLIPPPDTPEDERLSLECRVLEMFRSRFGPEIALRVEFVERIEPSEAGKHVFMLSRVPDA